MTDPEATCKGFDMDGKLVGFSTMDRNGIHLGKPEARRRTALYMDSSLLCEVAGRYI